MIMVHLTGGTIACMFCQQLHSYFYTRSVFRVLA